MEYDYEIIESSTETEEETTEQVPVATNPTMEEVAQEGFKQIVQQQIQESTDLRETTRDLTYLKGASDLQDNAQFRDEYQGEMGKQLVKDLKNEGKKSEIDASAKIYEAKALRNEAYFKGWKPLFDLLGIDHAYGLGAMIGTTIVLFIPFLLVCIIRFIINGINGIFTDISKFKKPAFWICTIIIVAAITMVAVIGLCVLLDKGFGINIPFLDKE